MYIYNQLPECARTGNNLNVGIYIKEEDRWLPQHSYQERKIVNIVHNNRYNMREESPKWMGFSFRRVRRSCKPWRTWNTPQLGFDPDLIWRRRFWKNMKDGSPKLMGFSYNSEMGRFWNYYYIFCLLGTLYFNHPTNNHSDCEFRLKKSKILLPFIHVAQHNTTHHCCCTLRLPISDCPGR
jgi:hypothetical protein